MSEHEICEMHVRVNAESGDRLIQPFNGEVARLARWGKERGTYPDGCKSNWTAHYSLTYKDQFISSTSTIEHAVLLREMAVTLEAAASGAVHSVDDILDVGVVVLDLSDDGGLPGAPGGQDEGVQAQGGDVGRQGGQSGEERDGGHDDPEDGRPAVEATQDQGLGQEVRDAPHGRTVAEEVAYRVSLARSDLIKYAAQITENDGRLTADSSASLDLALDMFEEALLVIRTNGLRDAYIHWKGEMEREGRYQEETRLRRAREFNPLQHVLGRHSYARDRAQEMAGVAEVMIESCNQRILERGA